MNNTNERKYMAQGAPSNEINIIGPICEQSMREAILQVREYCYYIEFVETYNTRVTKDYQIELEPLIINIATGGGSVYHGLAFMDALDEVKVPIFTHVYGMCMSMGIPIYLKGDVRTAGKNAKFMIHGISSGEYGYLDEIEGNIEHTKQMSKEIEEFILERTDIPKAHVKNARTKCKYYNYEEALKYGIITDDLYCMELPNEVQEALQEKLQEKQSKEEENKDTKVELTKEEKLSKVGEKVKVSYKDDLHEGIIVGYCEEMDAFKVFIENLSEVIYCNF